ncbi:hypothetical protein [Geopsychrobacter electrodiphilus]|uniref:hypothetical protein n=1 Tax=Geopsychrobacter electrodiphilus TaxID=225196 RepID=UPI00036FFF60|nr:hypothetical protein [Geopsychrobacter electrodiphilus]
MEMLKTYMESRSEGVLRLLEGGKRRGLEELRKGNGRGTQKALFEIVASSQHTFLELHHRCQMALRFAHGETAREVALDIQYLLYLFSKRVYEVAFSRDETDPSISFPPPEAYSRHYPGSGPEEPESQRLFRRYFDDTVYSTDKSRLQVGAELDVARKERLAQVLGQPSAA